MKHLLYDLFGNWGANIGDKQLRIWLQAIEDGRWTETEVAEAVKACQHDRDRTFCPKGFAEFARYLPARYTPPPQLAWWHPDGSWGGDWSKSDPHDMAEYAGIMQLRHDPTNRERVNEFVRLINSRGGMRHAA